MQQIKLKKSALVAVMVLSTGYIGNASAHSLSETLPTISTMAYDLYQVSCPSGSPTNLQARVRGYGAASATTPLVRVSVSKARLGLPSLTAFATDSTNNDGSLVGDLISGGSAFATVNGGAGIYSIVVQKSASAVVNYNMEFHCRGAGGVHTQTNGAINTTADFDLLVDL